MRIDLRAGVPVIAGLCVALALLATRAAAPDLFERLRLVVFDGIQRAYPWHAEGIKVEVIDIDDQSLRRIGQWPWSRSILADLVRALQGVGAKAVAFDVVFAEPDRTSPARLAKEWEHAFGWRTPAEAASALPDYDQDFASALTRGSAVMGFGLLAADNGAAPTVKASVATIGGSPVDTIDNFHGAVANLPALETAASGVGSFTIIAGRDQVVRTMPLIAAFNGKLVPSLALEALRVAQDEDTIGVRAERDGGPSGPVTSYTLKVGDFEAPVNREGALILHHGPRPAQNTISAWKLLDSEQVAKLAATLRGSIAVIGTSAVGLSDLRATPLNPLEPGVNMQARAIEQILAQHFIRRPAWAEGAEWVVALAISLMLIGAASFAGPQIAVFAMAACLVGLAVTTCWAFSSSLFLIDPSFIGVVAISSAIASSFARYFVSERDAARVRSAFTHYLSPELVAALARDPRRLRLGGEEREMTFLFTDLAGFTSLTESTAPEMLVRLLNAYLDGLSGIAMDHGGTVDKIVGDAVHVMFNAPLDQPDHPERAVRCALAMDHFAQNYAAAQTSSGTAFGVTRIGVNTGVAVVGNFGGARRFDYTAHGDAINTAARLEAANKTLGTRICVSRSTAGKVDSIAFLPVGILMLKGKSHGVEVLTPLSERAPWSAAYVDALERMLGGDETASAAIIRLHELHPEQPVLALHAKRIRAGERTTRMAA